MITVMILNNFNQKLLIVFHNIFIDMITKPDTPKVCVSDFCFLSKTYWSLLGFMEVLLISMI